MLLELCVLAGVQAGYRYFKKKSSGNQASVDEARAQDRQERNDEPQRDEANVPPVAQTVEPAVPIPTNPNGIQIGLGSLALAALGDSLPLHLLSTGVVGSTVAPIHQKAWTEFVEKGQFKNDGLFSLFSVLALASGFTVPVAVSYMFYELGSHVLRKTSARTQEITFDSFSQLPRSVWLLKDGAEQQVPLSEVNVGDIVVVSSGEVVPVDGQIVEGHALVDQHQLTGEAQPIEKGVADWVLASTLVTTGRVQVKIVKTGADTNVARIAKMMTDIAQTKPEIVSQGERLADQIAIPILALSGATLLGLGFPGALVLLNSGFGNRIRVLGPLSTLNYLNIATQSGILVKSGTALEQLNRIDTVLFDKTGTLTLPTLKTGKVTTYHSYDEREILAYAAGAEQRQTHPIAKAILQTAQELKLDLPACDESSYRIGYGVSVKRMDGRVIRVGNDRFMEAEGIHRPEQMVHDVAHAREAGESVVVVALDDLVVGTIIIQAEVRPEVPEIIAGLKERGIQQMAIVSGDHAGPTKILAKSLDIDDYFAEVLPTDKASIVRQLQEQGRVVCFIGDGINDSVAMQQADVSISLSGASTIATDCASVVLMDGSLKHLCQLFDIAKKLDTNVRTSFWIFGAFAVINLGGSFVGLGIYDSVFLKVLSSIAVLGNAAIPLVEQRPSGTQTPAKESDSPEAWSGDVSSAQ